MDGRQGAGSCADVQSCAVAGTANGTSAHGSPRGERAALLRQRGDGAGQRDTPLGMRERGDRTQGEFQAAPLPPPDEGPSPSVPWWEQADPVKVPRHQAEGPLDADEPPDAAVKKTKAPAPPLHPYHGFLQKWGRSSDAEEVEEQKITHTRLSPLTLRFENLLAESQYGRSLVSAKREVGPWP